MTVAIVMIANNVKIVTIVTNATVQLHVSSVQDANSVQFVIIVVTVAIAIAALSVIVVFTVLMLEQ